MAPDDRVPVTLSLDYIDVPELTLGDSIRFDLALRSPALFRVPANVAPFFVFFTGAIPQLTMRSCLPAALRNGQLHLRS